jgi:hypothetical protein
MLPEGKQHQRSEYSDLLLSPSPTDIDSTFFRRGGKQASTDANETYLLIRLNKLNGDSSHSLFLWVYEW